MIPPGPYYYTDAKGELVGPYSAAGVRALLASGLLQPETALCTEGGQGEWLRANDIPAAPTPDDLSPAESFREEILGGLIRHWRAVLVLLLVASALIYLANRPPFRRQTVFVTDTAADADLQRLADAGWKIVFTRRAQAEGVPDLFVGEWGYEMIVEGRARSEFRPTPTRREERQVSIEGWKSLFQVGALYRCEEDLPLFGSLHDAAGWPNSRRDVEYVRRHHLKSAESRGLCWLKPGERLRLRRLALWDLREQVLEVEVLDGNFAGKVMYCEPVLRPVPLK